MRKPIFSQPFPPPLRGRRVPSVTPTKSGNGEDCPNARDLLATARIILPDGGDKDLDELMKKWRAGKAYDPRKGMG